MKALRVDFAPPSPWPARLAYGSSAAILLVALWQGELAWRDWQALRTAKAGTAALRQQLDAAVARINPPSAAASAPPYERDARDIARIASFDAGGALRAIESAQIVGAKVASIDIDAQARRVVIALEVTNADVATAYVEALNAGDDHPKWMLARLQAQAGGDSAEIRGEFP